MAVRERKSTAERREEIARAALCIIGRQGVTSLTTAALAREVGLTSGALFRHFASLDEMLLETVRYALARIERTFPDASLPPSERLLQLGINRVRFIRSEPGFSWLLRSEEAYLALPADGVELLRKLVRRSRRYLLTAIRDGVLDGSIRDDIEPETLLIMVTGTIQSLAGMPGLAGKAAPPRQQDADQALAALSGMLRPPGQQTRTT